MSSKANGKAAHKWNILSGEREDNFASRPAYLVATALVEKEEDIKEDNVKSSQSAEDEDSTQDGPQDKTRARLTEEERLSAQKGTKTKNAQAKATAHYKIGSSKIRWENVAHDLGNGFKDARKWRFRKKRNAGSELTEEEQESDDDAEGTAKLPLPIILGSIFGGVMVLPCLLTGIFCLWYVSKRCRASHFSLSNGRPMMKGL